MDKFALVTGASSGIGKACALALLQEGWHVALTARRVEALNDTIVGAGANGARALALPCDIGDSAAVAAAFATLQQRFGRLDLVFNNAGISPRATTPDDLSAQEWDRGVATNLSGAFYVLSNAFRLMKSQSPMGGRIINNGSISAHAPRPGSIAYTATKHAVTGLTKTAALDGRPFDIAVGQIDIGNVASDMTEKMAKGVPQADGSIKPEPRMDMQAVVDTFMGMARLPLSANVLFTTVMATKMPFVGRG